MSRLDPHSRSVTKPPICLLALCGALWLTACGSPPDTPRKPEVLKTSTAALLDFQVELPDKAFISTSGGSVSDGYHVMHTGNDTADCGPEARPCKTLRHAVGRLPEGTTLYVHGSPTPYEGTNGYITLSGNPNKPRRIVGLDHYQNKARIIPYGTRNPFDFGETQYWVLSNVLIDCQDKDVTGVYLAFSDHIAVMNSNIEHCQDGAIALRGASHVTVSGNHLAHNLGTAPHPDYPNITVRADGNGVTMEYGTHHVHIANNYSYDNSGDSVQCQGSEQEDLLEGGSQNTLLDSRHITIEGNDFHDNMENAVDIKSCQDVLITGANRFYNLYAAEEWHDNTPICGGAAVIVHYKATRVRIEDANIFDSGIGIEVGRYDMPGASDIVIRRNRIHNMNQNLVTTWPRAQKKFNCGDGITIHRAANVEVYHNTLHKIPHSGIQVRPSSNHAAWEDARDIRIWNNIISEVSGFAYNDPADTEPPFTPTNRTGGTLFFQPLRVAGVFTSENNLFYHPTGARFRLDGTAGLTLASWQAQTPFDHEGSAPTRSNEGNPLFRNGFAGDLRLRPGSAGIDTAFADTTNATRRCGGSSLPDRGAVESDCPTSEFPDPVWGVQRGTQFTDRIHAIATNSVGDVFYAGTSDGSFGFANQGYDDAFVGRYSVTGGQGWTRQMGTASTDMGNGVAVDALDNVFLAGATGGNLGSVNAGGYDAYVVKYDKNGTRQWSSQFGGAASERLNSITTDGANLYVAGAITNQQTDFYLARLNPDGSVAWTRTAGTSFAEELTSIAYNAALDSVFVTGHGKTGSIGYFKRLYLARYSSSGTLIWETWRDMPAPSYFEILSNGVAVDAAGGVYVGGRTRPGSELDNPFLYKFDGASGALQWTRDWHEFGYSSAIIWSVATSPDGHVYASGNASHHMALWKFTSGGMRVWPAPVGVLAGTYTYGFGLAVDPYGDVVSGGSTFTDIFAPSQGGPDDAWIVKYPGQ
ncbi:right-handed parallel beta-helix repeat-containing protein [Corallococcus exercitus]|uniref:right-handed parallel beta-helix repeat-containing protein n=1 Tax=Corallococcus exercitus TaxID=2316736 RepID=UPI0035D4D19D